MASLDRFAELQSVRARHRRPWSASHDPAQQIVECVPRTDPEHAYNQQVPSPDPNESVVLSEKRHKRSFFSRKKKRQTEESGEGRGAAGRGAQQHEEGIEASEDPFQMALFYQQSDAVRSEFAKMEGYTHCLAQANTRALSATSEDQMREGEAVISATIGLMNDSTGTVRQTLEAIREANDALSTRRAASTGDLRMRRLNYAALTKRFGRIVTDFQDVQVHARSKHQELVQRQYKLSMDPSATRAG